MSDDRNIEVSKYIRAYQIPSYKMGPSRYSSARRDLESLTPGSLLDVGCGRGEILILAKTMGFAPVTGTEVVPVLLDEDVIYACAHELPFQRNSYDYVTMYDVMEHLLEEDCEFACHELERVARKNVILTVASFPHKVNGDDLHITIKPYDTWFELFNHWFSGTVHWVDNRGSISETFWIEV